MLNQETYTLASVTISIDLYSLEIDDRISEIGVDDLECRKDFSAGLLCPVKH